MIEKTQNNHLVYYYNNDKSQTWRHSKDDVTHMQVGGCSRRPFAARIEWAQAARLIYDHHPDLTIFMSGGLDSEIAFRSFVAAGIRPRIATVKFANDKNMYDIGPMIDMIQNQFGFDINVIDFDPEEFCLSGEYLDIAARYQAYSFYQQMLLKIAEKHSSPMITVDEIELKKEPTINFDTGLTEWNWCFVKKEDQDAVWHRFTEKTGIPALNNFYTYTPESMLAFLQLPTVQDLINDKIPYKMSWTSSKNKIYSEAGYRFRLRPKYHGMENYVHIWDYVLTNTADTIKQFDSKTYIIDALVLENNLRNGAVTTCNIA